MLRLYLKVSNGTAAVALYTFGKLQKKRMAPKWGRRVLFGKFSQPVSTQGGGLKRSAKLPLLFQAVAAWTLRDALSQRKDFTTPSTKGEPHTFQERVWADSKLRKVQLQTAVGSYCCHHQQDPLISWRQGKQASTLEEPGLPFFSPCIQGFMVVVVPPRVQMGGVQLRGFQGLGYLVSKLCAAIISWKKAEWHQRV